MKILMTNDAFNVFIIRICSGFRTGEYVFRVENIKALILHGPHVEMTDRDDHVEIKIIFTAKAAFIPAHGVD